MSKYYIVTYYNAETNTRRTQKVRAKSEASAKWLGTELRRLRERVESILPE